MQHQQLQTTQTMRSPFSSKNTKDRSREKIFLERKLVEIILEILECYKVFSTYFATIDLCKILCATLINDFCPFFLLQFTFFLDVPFLFPKNAINVFIFCFSCNITRFKIIVTNSINHFFSKLFRF